MEEPVGAQYALQIAVHTLKDRCRSFQQRIAILEEENLNLRISCNRNQENEHPLSEVEKLKEQITELTEHKEQLQNKIKLVTSENQELWKKLGKLTKVNESLGNHLTQINETLSQHMSSPVPTHTALIRSKTFTQDEPHIKILQKNLEENNKISLELEDISLKLINSFSKEKFDLESLCTDLADIHCTDNIITDSFGFCYDDELDDDVLDEFKVAVEELQNIKAEVLEQKAILARNLMNVNIFKDNKCSEKKEFCDKSISTDQPSPKRSTPNKLHTSEMSSSPEVLPLNKISAPEVDKICPMCSRLFTKDVDFPQFQQHVEDHFRTEPDGFEML